MPTKTQIANIAIGFLGHTRQISNLDDENSAEASTLRLLYEQALKEILREFPWGFATKIAELSLVEEDPNEEWAYSYRYLSDALFIRRILSGVRQDNRESTVPFQIHSDSTGQLIMTDWPEAEVEYTFFHQDPDKYPADFVFSLAYRLAAYAAPTFAKDPRLLAPIMERFYAMSIAKAQATNGNEGRVDVPPEAEMTRGR